MTQIFLFDCLSRNMIETRHKVEAESPDDAIEVHQRNFPEHMFRGAFVIPPRAKRARRVPPEGLP